MGFSPEFAGDAEFQLGALSACSEKGSVDVVKQCPLSAKGVTCLHLRSTKLLPCVLQSMGNIR